MSAVLDGVRAIAIHDLFLDIFAGELKSETIEDYASIDGGLKEQRVRKRCIRKMKALISSFNL